MVSPAVDLARLVALPPDERLALVQALWDSLRADAGAFPLSGEERALIAARRAEAAASPKALVLWEDVRAELWADQTEDEAAAPDSSR